jgi:hypothetical protein
VYSLDRRLGGPQSRFEQHGEENNLAPTGTRTRTPYIYGFVLFKSDVDCGEMTRSSSLIGAP